MNILSVIAFIYFLYMTSVSVSISRQLFGSAKKHGSIITFLIGAFVFLMALLSLGGLLVSLNIIPLNT
jgi:hypothetical protein